MYGQKQVCTMKKFTFIMNFRGGTYISQVNAMNIDGALVDWAKNLNINDIQYFGPSSKLELIELMSQDYIYPVLIHGMENVWCMGGSLKMGTFLLNIVMS